MATQKSSSQRSEKTAKNATRNASPNDTAPDGSRIDPKAAEEAERRLRAGRSDDAEPEEDLETVGPDGTHYDTDALEDGERRLRGKDVSEERSS